VTTAEAHEAPAASSAVRPVARPSGSRPDREPEILDRARLALGSGDLPAVLAALAEHARLFPGKQSAARRSEA
jgi:RNA polymerase sigma factor (sigma-70 family)